MNYEELKGEFDRFGREEKQHFTEEIGFGLCKELMADSAFVDRMMPRYMEMMGQMPEAMRWRVSEWATGRRES